MSNKLTVSIVMPNYNGATYLEESIVSVLRVRRRADYLVKVEFVFIDGASTDASMDIVTRYSRDIDMIVTERDNGQASAINKGLNAASGDILAYLNSDDTYCEDALLHVAESYMTHHWSWLAGNVIRIDGHGNHMGVAASVCPDDVAEWIAPRLGAKSRIQQPATFFHRSVFDEHGLFREDMQYAFDREYYVRLKANGLSPFVVNKELACFRIHALSKTNSKSACFIEEDYQVTLGYSEHIPDAYERNMTVARMLRMAQRANMNIAVADNHMGIYRKMMTIYNQLKRRPTLEMTVYALRMAYHVMSWSIRRIKIRHQSV